eukprot:s2324_g7.t1
MQVKRNDRQPHNVVLAACAGPHEEHQSSELQLFHRGNRDGSKRGKPCCSGMMHWNFLQCLDAQNVGTQVRTFECEIGGSSSHQKVELSEDGQLLWNWMSSWGGARGCFAPQPPKVGKAVVSRIDDCSAAVEPVGEATHKAAGGLKVPAEFRIKSGDESVSGLELQFRPCDLQDGAQIFKATARFGGFEIKTGDGRNCLDSSGGRDVRTHPEATTAEDQDDGRCLSALSGNVLGLSECTPQQRWRLRSQGGASQVQHVLSANCIDAGSEHKPILYPCHNGHVNQPQKFTFIANPGWIQNPITWGDNGRRRTFETCLDRLPTQQQNIAVLDCADTRSSGVRWDALGIWRGRCITAMDIAKHAVEFQPVLAVTTSRNGRESWHRRFSLSARSVKQKGSFGMRQTSHLPARRSWAAIKRHLESRGLSRCCGWRFRHSSFYGVVESLLVGMHGFTRLIVTKVEVLVRCSRLLGGIMGFVDPWPGRYELSMKLASLEQDEIGPQVRCCPFPLTTAAMDCVFQDFSHD